MATSKLRMFSILHSISIRDCLVISQPVDLHRFNMELMLGGQISFILLANMMIEAATNCQLDYLSKRPFLCNNSKYQTLKQLVSFVTFLSNYISHLIAQRLDQSSTESIEDEDVQIVVFVPYLLKSWQTGTEGDLSNCRVDQ